MKILVTGGAGFIGSHVAESFASMGDEVVVFDNLTRSKLLGKGDEWRLYNWNYLKSHYPNVKLIEGDVRNFSAVESSAKGCEMIVHTAAQVAVTTSISDPVLDFLINAYGTLNVLEAARRNDAGFVLMSTNKVYGDKVNEIPLKDIGTRYVYADAGLKNGIPETFPLDGSTHTPYGCSKLAADIYTQDYGKVYGLRSVILRMSCIYGERQFGVEDQGWVAHFAKQIIAGEKITIYGDGKQVRDVLHIQDLVKVVQKICEKSSQFKGTVFNIGGGPENSLSLLEAIDFLSGLHGQRPRIEFRDWRLADQKVYVSDVRKARDSLGWTPTIKWIDGLTRLYRWLYTVF